MALTCDAYTWIDPPDRANALRQFVNDFVDESPGEPRFDAFVRTYVDENPRAADLASIAELRMNGSLDIDQPFALHLRSKQYNGVIAALTVEGSFVLGLSLDDPNNDPAIWRQAQVEVERMAVRLGGVEVIGGVELPPPRSHEDWLDDALVAFRSDVVPE